MTQSRRIPDHTKIRFDNGVISGEGIVRGISHNEIAVIGHGYIIEVTKSNIDHQEYPYSFLSVDEVHIAII